MYVHTLSVLLFVGMVCLPMFALRGVDASRATNITFADGDFTLIPPFGMVPPKRLEFCAVSDGDRTFTLLGSTVLRESNDVYVYDGTVWSILAQEGDTVPPRLRPMCWVTDKYIVVFGGEDSNVGTRADTYRYTLKSTIWVKGPSSSVNMPSARHSGLTFNYNSSHVGLYGGVSENGYVDDLWLMNVESMEWASVPQRTHRASHSTLPSTSEEASHIIGAVITALSVADTMTLLVYVPPTRNLWEFNFSSAEWTNRTAVSGAGALAPSSRTHVGYAVQNNTLIMCCGSSKDTAEGEGERLLGDVWAMNLTTRKWTLGSQKLPVRASPRVVAHNGHLRVIGGVNESDILNDILTVPFSKDGGGDTQRATAPYESGMDHPPPRSFHTASLYGEHLVVFGGISTDMTALADVWEFNLRTYFWRQVPTQRSPAPRYAHVAGQFSNYVVVFGGVAGDGTTILSDQWMITVVTWEWTQMSISLPPKRYYAASTVCGTDWFVYGGRDGTNILQDLWSFNLESLKWSKIFDYNDPGPLYRGAMSGNGTHFYLMGGTKDAVRNSIDVWIFHIEKQKWTRVGAFGIPLSGGMAATIKNNPLAVIYTGGEYGGKIMPFGQHTWVVTPNQTYEYPSVTAPPRVGGTLLFFAHRVIQVFGVQPTLNGDLTFHNPSAFVYENTMYQSICTPGTYVNVTADICEECHSGTYADSWGSSGCTPCPPGTYQQHHAAQSKAFCLPCSVGTYAPQGSTYECTPCSSSSDSDDAPSCPARRSTMLSAEATAKRVTSHHQPRVAPSTEYMHQLKTFRRGIVIAFPVGCLILVLIFSAMSLRRASLKRWTRLDAFFPQHLVSQTVDFAKWRRTPVGGLMTVVGVLLGALVVLGVIAAPVVSNVVESRGLLPSSFFEDQPVSFGFRLRLQDYTGECLRGAACSSKLAMSMSKIESLKATGTADVICWVEPSTCVVQWECPRCKFTSTAASVDLTFSDEEARAWGILWEIYSSQNVITGALYPKTKGAYFQGISSASKIVSGVQRSVHGDRRTKASESGLQLKFMSQAPGEEVVGEANRYGLRAQIQFKQETYTLYIERRQYLAPVVIAALCIGGFSGVVTVLQLMVRLWSKYLQVSGDAVPQWRRMREVKRRESVVA